MEGGWLCLLLLNVSIRCVSHSFQNASFFIIILGLVIMDFLPFLACGR